MKLAALCSLALIAAAFCSAPASAAYVANPPHTVFLLHGLRGTPENTFCDMKQELEKRFNTGGVNRILVQPLAYDTFSNSDGHYDFMQQVHVQIRHHFRQHNLDPKTAPYSLIMHSQGGVVGFKWVFKCVMWKKYCTPIGAPENLRYFITLGSPLWGSPGAGNLDKDAGLRDLIGFPPQQVAELSYGSKSFFYNRRMFLGMLLGSRDPVPGSVPFPPEAQIYNFAGNIARITRRMKESPFDDILDRLSPIPSLKKVALRLRDLIVAGGEVDNETDIAVDVPSARADFYYRIERKTGDGSIRVFQDRTPIARRHFIPLEMSHIQLDPPLSDVFPEPVNGMACVKKGKPHPVTDYLEAILRGQTIDPNFMMGDPQLSQPVRTFLSEVKFLLPAGYQRRIDFENAISGVRVIGDDQSKIATLHLRNSSLNRYNLENFEDLAVQTQAPKWGYTYQHVGRFTPDFDYEPALNTVRDALPVAELEYSLKIPGWKLKRFTQKVSPSYSSYAEAILEPILPIAAAGDKADDGRYVHGGREFILNTHSLGNKTRVALMDVRTRGLEIRDLDSRQFEALKGTSVKKADLAPSCFLAKVGQIESIHKARLYAARDLKSLGRRLFPGEVVQVLGRYQLTDGDVVKDVYLISTHGLDRHPGLPRDLAWIRVRDVDYFGSSSCPALPAAL